MNILRWYIALGGFEGALVIIRLMSLPGSTVSQGSLGLSPGRWALAAPALLLAIVFAWAAALTRGRRGWVGRQAQHLAELSRRDSLYGTALALLGMFFILSLNILLLNWKNTDPYVQAYLMRLAPYACWGLLLCVQSALALRGLRYGVVLGAPKGYWKFLIVMISLAILAVFVSATKIGLAPDLFAWGDPGVPLLSWQIAVALVIALAAWLVGRLLSSWLGKSQRLRSAWTNPHLLDFFICLLLWAGAVWRWGVEPLRPSYFSPQPLPPNEEYYPYSDAATYDLSAQSLLLGYGLGKDVVRPFYSFFLAMAQAFNGIGYQRVLAWQIPVLALLPALLYLIAKTLHNRFSGFFVGLLGIFHESNSIALADIANVSHAKLLMSDVPTTLGIVAITAIIVLWLENTESRQVHPLVMGALLAVVMLIRLQVIVLLPVILLVVCIASWKNRQALSNSALVLAGFLCVTIPWLWRNGQVSGRITLTGASQESQIGLIGQRYSLTIQNELGQRYPGETDDAYTTRMIRSAISFVQQHPGETARFLTAHFLHNQVATLLALPASFLLVDLLNDYTNGLLLRQSPDLPAVWGRCCSLGAAVKNLGYWSAWDGEFAANSGLPVWTALLLVAAGIGVAWKRRPIAGLVPLALNAAYSVSNALVRNSGWRFNQPVDWVGYLFYGIGIVQLGIWGLAFFFPHPSRPGVGLDMIVQPSQTHPQSLKSSPRRGRSRGMGLTLLAGVLFLLLGAASPIVEKAVPERYRDVQVNELLANLQAQGVFKPDEFSLQAFLSQPGSEAVVGRGLYPRYYQAGEGEPGSGWPSLTPRPYNRLGFYLMGPSRRQVVLPLTAAPAHFPNGSDVLVLGCYTGDYLDAYLAVILEPAPVILRRSPLKEWSCSGSCGCK